MKPLFDCIYKRWGKPLFRFVLNIIGSQEAAGDICKETFVKLWLTCDSIDTDKNIRRRFKKHVIYYVVFQYYI